MSAKPIGWANIDGAVRKVFDAGSGCHFVNYRKDWVRWHGPVLSSRPKIRTRPLNLTARAIRMHRSGLVDGHPVDFNRSICGWVAIIGDEAVTFKQVAKRRWLAKRRWALEPMAAGETLAEAFRAAKKRCEEFQRERKAKLQARIREAFALLRA